MTRMVVLALLTLVLPTAALANFVPVTWKTGPITTPPSRGVISRTSLGGLSNGGSAIILGSGVAPGPPFEVGLNGLIFAGGNTAPCTTVAGGTCTILSGTVTVLNASLTQTLFMGTLDGGTVTTKGIGEAIYNVDIAPNPVTAPAGGFVHMDALLTTSPVNSSMLPGSSAVAALVPEPTTLCLLGTSVIGLAGMVRRRLGK